jgi:hypothetical protein
MTPGAGPEAVTEDLIIIDAGEPTLLAPVQTN